MHTNRREFLKKSVLLSGVSSLGMSPSPKQDESVSQEGNRLILLGTQGGPFVRSYNQIPSANLIVYKSIPFVIDTGYGTTFKLKEAGLNLPTLKYIFITHLHSDHYLDLGPLLYNAWVAGLADTVNVYAPIGINALLAAYWESNRFDIETRINDEGRPDIRQLVKGHEVVEGVLIKNSDFEISALRNIHPPIENSYAFKFVLGSSIVVFSGDTAYCPALTQFAANATYLVHEVMYTPAVDDIAKRRPNATRLIASIKSHHTSAEDVGRIAHTANVKTLVLNHFVPADDKSLTDQLWIDTVSKTFSGKVIIGKDLLQLPL